jgi:hypothetical protein
MNTKILLMLQALTVTSILTISTAALAAEAEINFDVPINIQNYPVPNQVLATWCELRTVQGRVLSGGPKHFPLSNGAYSGSQQVKVNYPISEAVNIKNYRCAILVERSTAGAGDSKTIPSDATILSQVNGTF